MASSKHTVFDSELSLLALIYVTAAAADGVITQGERDELSAFLVRRYPDAGARLDQYLAGANEKAETMNAEGRIAYIEAELPRALADLSANERATLGDELMRLAWSDRELSDGEKELAVRITRAFARQR